MNEKAEKGRVNNASLFKVSQGDTAPQCHLRAWVLSHRLGRCWGLRRAGWLIGWCSGLGGRRPSPPPAPRSASLEHGETWETRAQVRRPGSAQLHHGVTERESGEGPYCTDTPTPPWSFRKGTLLEGVLEPRWEGGTWPSVGSVCVVCVWWIYLAYLRSVICSVSDERDLWCVSDMYDLWCVIVCAYMYLKCM